MNTLILRTRLLSIDTTARLPRVLRRVGIQFVGTLQFALVLETLSLHRFFAFRCFRVQLFGFSCLPVSFGCASIGLSLCAFRLCPLLFDFGFSGTNIVFGLGGLLPNLRGLFPLPFALLRCSLAADCDDDPDDDQDHNDGDNDPDDG